MIVIIFILIGTNHSTSCLLAFKSVASDVKKTYLINEFLNAHTAYGPGLGVFTPYWYADISYDNIPFVGKIISGGKEGTSSRLRINPINPLSKSPDNPFPPLYKARPLPPHVPEPMDVIAVPLEEESLHGEPLFPKGFLSSNYNPFNNPFGESIARQNEKGDRVVHSDSTSQTSDNIYLGKLIFILH
ncbi:unnamed protein product [Thelazia callipaeda]|uniref:Spondin domain-containing protein n=1 Tax=Thelazia callipaeda TaxID=103827 RepID=A0A3P7L120_THECL|nr:unnamed protein product [Thelazia callipaeda]